MKKLIALLLILSACSTSTTKDTRSQDSVNSSKKIVQLSPFPDSVQTAAEADSLTLRYGIVSQGIFQKTETYHEINIVTRQHEGSSRVIWYLDADFSPVYFKQTWSSEGNEGATELFIEDGDVSCSYIKERDLAEKWCSSTGGTRTISNENSDDLSERLPLDYGMNCNEQLSRFLDVLETLIEESEISKQDEASYTLLSEHALDVGVEVTESVEVTVPKVVYKFFKIE
jgi:hypothetical protein